MEVPRLEAFSDLTIQGTYVFVIPDTTQDPRIAASPLVTAGDLIRLHTGAPLIYLGHVTLGSLCILERGPRRFTLSDHAKLMNMVEELVSIGTRGDFKRVSGLLDR